MPNSGFIYQNQESPGARNYRLTELYNKHAVLLGKDTIPTPPEPYYLLKSITDGSQKLSYRGTEEIVQENASLMDYCVKHNLCKRED